MKIKIAMRFISWVKQNFITVFGIFFLIASFDFIKTSILKAYYLGLRKTENVQGHVLKSENEGKGSDSFEYTVSYPDSGRIKEFKERLSPDSIILSFDSSIIVRKSTVNNSFVTIQNRGFHYFTFVMSLLVLFVCLIMIFKSKFSFEEVEDTNIPRL